MYQGSACIYRVVIHKRVPKHIVNQAKVFIVEFKALWPYACALGVSIKVALLLPYCAFIASLFFESPTSTEHPSRPISLLQAVFSHLLLAEVLQETVFFHLPASRQDSQHSLPGKGLPGRLWYRPVPWWGEKVNY